MASRTESPTAAVITTARAGRTADRRHRMRNYIIAMSLRVVCFVLILVVDNTYTRIGLIVAAGVLPGVAVLLANAVDRRGHATPVVEPGFPERHTALSAHHVIPHDD